MSKYTTELRYIIESGVKLPLNNYPIFDEEYRTKLNELIINHFYFREIGVEPYGKFALFLSRKMNEIMPFYNTLYKSKIDLFLTNYENTIDSNVYEGNSKNEQTLGTQTKLESKAINKEYANDTPMGSLGDIFSENYASTSGVGKSENTNTQTNSGTDTFANKTNTKDERNILKQGYNSSIPLYKVLSEMNQDFLTIDLMIINALEPLFMSVW